MRRARIFFRDRPAGVLTENDKNHYVFEYDEGYAGMPISLTMPVSKHRFEFKSFPPFFDGLLPEGPQLEGLLRQAKLDRSDVFGQLVAVGHDLVGAVTVEEMRA